VADMIENHLFLVAENEAGPQGFAGGMVGRHPFNPEIRTLVEYFWWVKLEHRGGRAALKLLNAFLEWGERHVEWITFCTAPRIMNVSPSVLERRGFRHFESAFVKEIA
jgi:RimJ/RimL family protein N-acetyltransferase